MHVLLDWVGSNKMDPKHLAAMEATGVEVRKVHKPAWYSLACTNNRTHRKVLVVDGKVGYTGGVGIADLWTGDAQDPQHWRDTHFRAEGPVVAQMQAVFLDNWIKATGVVLHGDDYFPELPAAWNDDAQMFSSSPSDGSESMHLMYQPTMYHCKVLIIDSLMVSVGSTNFDTRSFRLNDEANLNIYAADFTRQQVDVFNADLSHSRRVSLHEWQQRPLSEKILEYAASLIGAQL